MNNSLKSELTYKYLIAACLASLVISTFASYFFYNRWSEAEDRYIAIVNQMNLVTRNHNDLKHSFDKVFGDLMIMRDENAKIIVLYAADTTKSSTVRVYWNSSTRETFVDVISLSSPDSTRQFQLWAMVKGQATDAGLFNVNPDAGIQRLKLVMNADAWVVTLEPAGGSTAPTPDQVYLISKL